MASPIVTTKLYVPRIRQGLVSRPRLRGPLRRGARLTLVSAPPGFGKTTLLAEWAADAVADDRHIAWLSLDASDDDPGSFWRHVIAALQVAMPGIGAAALAALESGQRPSEAFLVALLNELGESGTSVDVVLDDFHVIDHPDIQSGIAFLVERLPPQVHLVIATRSDPAFPLARLRARGDLAEVRAADLRFTLAEVSTFLTKGSDLRLAERDIATLAERTEGWIAALQLAALSMKGREDVGAFIAGFEGSDRYVVDYLVEEVLQRLPEDIRAFLRQTCFLDRLSGPLCDAVRGASGSRTALETLERANLFVVPHDDRRHWWRYHHLFADVVQTHFADELMSEQPLLRRRASDWYEQNGERFEAIRHALAGKDFERAAELIELAIPAIARGRREPLLHTWLKALPDASIRKRPVLGIGLVGALASSGQFDEVESRLQDAERHLVVTPVTGSGTDVTTTEGGIVTDRDQLRRLPGAIAMYRAAMAQIRGDVTATIDHARKSLALAPPDDHAGRAGAAGFLGIASWATGDLEAARRSWTACLEGLRRAGHVADTSGVAIALADIGTVQGRLRESREVCERTLHLVTEPPGVVLTGTADLHVGLAELSREQGDLEEAKRHLRTADELGRHAGLPQYPYRWHAALARLRQSEQEFDAALDLLDEAERVFVSDFFPVVRPLPAMKARVWIAAGRLNEAFRWQREAAVTSKDDPSYLREFEHITLARLLLAVSEGEEERSSDHVLLGLLDRLLRAAEKGGRMGSVIEISILQALAHRTGEEALAMGSFERALALAEPEGYVRMFVDEGPRIAPLLKLSVKRGLAPAYAKMLLAALVGEAATTRRAAHPDLIEPLTERELDVLRLLRSELDGPDIARELMVSLNTMRTHTKKIYEKLGVNSRRSAVRRAEELRLLQPTGR